MKKLIVFGLVGLALLILGAVAGAQVDRHDLWLRKLLVDTVVLNPQDSTDVNGATTFAATSSYMVLTCTGAETINTITGGETGQLLYIEHEDTDCTIADDDAATAADAIDLGGAATNSVGAAAKLLVLLYEGSHWQEVVETEG